MNEPTEFYAISNCNGPISVYLLSTTEEASIEEFENNYSREWIDDPRTDFEDMEEICADGMTKEEFFQELRANEFKLVKNLNDNWTLWAR
jgi:hypothetical protein